MRQLKYWVQMVTAIAIIALLAACGGSSSSKSDPGSEMVVVDPYITGAVLQELDADGVVVQESEASDENGVARFARTLTAGNLVQLQAGSGNHGGVPFKGTLKRKVHASEGNIKRVISPLTTLASELDDDDDAVVQILEDAGFAGFTKEDIYKDPMLALKDKTADNLTDADLLPVVANLAVNAALNTVSAKSGNIASVVSVVEAVKTVIFEIDPATEQSKILTAAKESSSTTVPVTTIVTSTLITTSNAVVAKVEKAKEEGTFDEETLATTITDVIKPQLPPVDDIVEETTENDGTPPIIDPDYDEQNPGDDDPFEDPPSDNVAEALDDAFAALVAFTGSENFEATGLNAVTEKFRTAKSLINADTSAQADKDAAHFFGAFAEFMALFNPYSDFVADNGLNNLGDLLDAFGIPAQGRGQLTALPIEGCDNLIDAETGDLLFEMCNPKVELAATAPTTGELQTEAGATLLATLGSVVSDLDKVSADFATERVLFADDEATIFDYNDALFVKAVAQAMHAQIGLIMAYDINVDLYELQQNPILLDGTSANDMIETYQQFLSDYPEFGTLADGYAARLDTAEANAKAAVDNLIAAIEGISEETADQANQFITWDDNVEDMEEDITNLTFLKDALAGPATHPTDTEALRVDLSKLFDGIDLREQLDVSVNVGTGKLTFPDPTVGGIIVDGIDINEDLNDNDIPDVLDDVAEMFGFQSVQ